MTRVILVSLLLMSVANAQGRGQSFIRVGPVTTRDRVSFRLAVMSQDLARVITVRLRVDNTSVSAPYATLEPPRVCTPQGQGWECEAYLPQLTVNSLNVPGRHDLYSFVFDGNCCESGPSNAWAITTPAATGFRIEVK